MPYCRARLTISSNDADNSFTCEKKQLAAYCAGGDIIIRCSGGKGYAGNCNDNLVGEPPLGNTGTAGCFQSGRWAGDGACTKAGLVYPGSGSGATNKTDPYPIPGTYPGSNVTTTTTTSSFSHSTMAPSGGLSTGISSGGLSTGISGGTGDNIQWQTVYTTTTIIGDCGDLPAVTPLSSSMSHHWANATATILIVPQPASATAVSTSTIPAAAISTAPSDGYVAAPAKTAKTSPPNDGYVAATAKAATSTSLTTTASASKTSASSTSTGPVAFTGAASASRPYHYGFILALAAIALV